MRRRQPTSVYAAVLEELDSNQLDGPALSGAVAAQDPYALLMRATAHADAGRFREARQDVAEARRLGADSSAVHIAAGMILYVCRDHHESLAAFDHAVECNPRTATRSYQERIRRAARLEWSQEVRQSIAAAVRHEPRNLRWHLEALRIYSHARDWESALQHAKAALEIEPGAEQVHMERAGILARLGRRQEALEASSAAIRLTPDYKYRMEAARVAIDVGAYDQAESYYAQAAEAYELDADARVGLATLALFRGRLDDASSWVEKALTLSPRNSAALRSRGAIAALREQHDDALTDLEAAIELDPDDYQARAWRAESLMRLGRFEECWKELHDATMRADGYLLAVWILRLLGRILQGDPQHILGGHRVEELKAGVDELVPEGCDDLVSGDHEKVSAVLEEALRRLAGNRSTMSSKLVDGELTRLSTRTAPRYGSRHALELVRTASPEIALSELDRIVEQFPESSLPICHRGELRLWMGDLEGARADLEAAIEILPQTRWAWIGLTGIDTLEGDYEKALRTSAEGVTRMGNTTGFSVFAYRADALRRLGRYEEAESDLDKSIGQHGSRVGAWLILGLTRAGRGDTQGLLAVWKRLEDQAIGLLSDAARELGEELWPQRDALPEPELAERVLEHALYMTRGNRSSTCATYLTQEGRVRFVPRYPHHGRAPHDADRDDLMKARTLLMQATGLSQPRRGRQRVEPTRDEESTVRHEPTLLTPEEIDHFLDKGFVTLRNCFPRDVGEAWVAEAVARIRTEPERWVKNYDPSNPARSLKNFDPEDPSTWTWSRIDLDGPRRVPIEELSPKLWQGICDILGGPDRVATRSIADYFILNLNDGAEREDPAPKPHMSSWHLDHPSVQTRLEGFDKGLILIVLFSDLATASGGTYLAPQSWKHVARLLAGRSEGVDFCDRTEGVRISSRCTELHEVTGQIGDAVLIHPLMIHSSSFNPSGRIRWMGNPMIELFAPIRLDRPDIADYSVLERSIRRAIDGE